MSYPTTGFDRGKRRLVVAVAVTFASLLAGCGFFSSDEAALPSGWKTVASGDVTVQVPPDIEPSMENPDWPFSGEGRSWRGEGVGLWVHSGEGAASPAGRSENVEITSRDIGGRSATVRYLSGEGENNSPVETLGDGLWLVATFGRTPDVVVWVSYSGVDEEDTAEMILDSVRFD